jgi:hypothetical protein
MDEIITRMADIADAALTRYHHVGYAERINALLDALHLISQERIEYINNKEGDDERTHPRAAANA